ncbi:hypothetical protein Misp01_23580 [Microtetraspora sp. NBRC 13810]|uniref:hypothetical protein n=1 Tax=Microtetraspora sp. NBRC 13810 TaxID=3030990 RepID=UPI0024A30E42|nr:hypothetical protein [Microtetraspora sp. NBRC 13810]GLW07228.1 hypothetical protein Misp01_23580 [Microtetraspora sp. NBRC 13810]
MADLLDLVIEAHGGLAPWRNAVSISAAVDMRGEFWAVKGQSDLVGGWKSVTADLSRQHITITPFGEDRSVVFDAVADRVRIVDKGGTLVDELAAPRAGMAGYAVDTRWSPAQTGYFISYALWLYLLEPFLLTLPGITTREVETWSEDEETWRRLEVAFPDGLASHSPTHTYYFDTETGLQRRVDYAPVVNGSPPSAHYTDEHRAFGGIVVPTRRRVLRRHLDNTAVHATPHILIDVEDVRLNP